MPRGGVHCGALGITGPSLLRGGSESPLAATPANFGVLRRQAPHLLEGVYYRATSNHAARLGRRCSYNNGVNSIAFGAALCFSDYCPHTCTVSATALALEAPGASWKCASDLDIPGTMSPNR
jgi:hypothetical protein